MGRGKGVGGGLKISEMYFRNVFAVDLFWSNLLLMFLPILDYGEGGGTFAVGQYPITCHALALILKIMQSFTLMQNTYQEFLGTEW